MPRNHIITNTIHICLNTENILRQTSDIIFHFALIIFHIARGGLVAGLLFYALNSKNITRRYFGGSALVLGLYQIIRFISCQHLVHQTNESYLNMFLMNYTLCVSNGSHGSTSMRSFNCDSQQH